MGGGGGGGGLVTNSCPTLATPCVNKLEPVIKRYKNGLKINGEFFIKFVGEESLSNMSYYVQFVGENKENYICLVDVYTGKIKLTKGV